MSAAPFTPEQEARLREIVREEGCATAATLRRVASGGGALMRHTPLRATTGDVLRIIRAGGCFQRDEPHAR